MTRTRKLTIAAVSTVALAAGVAGVAGAVGGDDEGDAQATGPDANRAKAAALKLVPGRANSVERDDEKGATWEVEITKLDGTTVDVRLGAAFEKVAIDDDSETEDESGPESESGQ